MKKKSLRHSRWILVTGLSGSGKTTALKVLEDQGFFTIDNLPVALLPSLIQWLKKSKRHFPKVVLGMDAREKHFLTSYTQVLQTLKGSGLKPEVLFFESSEKSLIQRFSESRRPHPLARRGSLARAIAEEKKRLEPLRKIATKTFNTSQMNVHQLKKALHLYLYPTQKPPPFSITILSFGFKYGIPMEADLLFDTRFLDNPYFVPSLKNLDGRTRSIKNFVLKQRNAKIFIRHILNFLDFLLPLYRKEGKTRLTLALGCTGGKHRSVVIAEELKKRLASKQSRMTIVHRDLEEAG